MADENLVERSARQGDEHHGDARAILRAAGITVIENTSKNVSILFLGPRGRGVGGPPHSSQRRCRDQEAGGQAADRPADGGPRCRAKAGEPDLPQIATEFRGLPRALCSGCCVRLSASARNVERRPGICLPWRQFVPWVARPGPGRGDAVSLRARLSHLFVTEGESCSRRLVTLPLGTRRRLVSMRG